MDNVMNKIIESMPKRIAKDLKEYPYNNNDVFEMILEAYNYFIDSEKWGNGYIFNISNQADLLCMVKNGMTAKEIATIYDNSQHTTSGCFFCDENHTDIQEIDTWEEIREILIFSLDELCEYVLTYVTRCEPYQAIYERYVTDTYLEYKEAESLRDKARLNEVLKKINA